jgi:uncharacterized protein (DUF362 family)
MPNSSESSQASLWTRRRFLKVAGVGALAAGTGLLFGRHVSTRETKTETFVASVSGYDTDLKGPILAGLRELGTEPTRIKGKSVLLKPNLVEPHRNLEHINTHPLVIRAAVEAFLSMGASKVVVAEGSGHRRDSLLVLEESGLADVLYEDKIPFIDLNLSSVVKVPNQGKTSKLDFFYFPEEVVEADIIVSMPKMKTHHWAGVTLSMKNLFGVMPGIVYGWPKNVLHHAGINECVYDLTATLKPHLAIVDGIVGMEGDGPIMGDPVRAGVVVMGANLPAVDATCARVMGLSSSKIAYLKHASGRIGTIQERNISQRGETIASVRRQFRLIETIPAHQGIRG